MSKLLYDPKKRFRQVPFSELPWTDKMEVVAVCVSAILLLMWAAYSAFVTITATPTPVYGLYTDGVAGYISELNAQETQAMNAAIESMMGTVSTDATDGVEEGTEAAEESITESAAGASTGEGAEEAGAAAATSGAEG